MSALSKLEELIQSLNEAIADQQHARREDILASLGQFAAEHGADSTPFHAASRYLTDAERPYGAYGLFEALPRRPHPDEAIEGYLVGGVHPWTALRAAVSQLRVITAQRDASLQQSGQAFKPLTPDEQAFFDTLTSDPQPGPDIVAKLAREGYSNFDEAKISKMWKRPKFQARGVRHEKKAGYYVLPTDAR